MFKLNYILFLIGIIGVTLVSIFIYQLGQVQKDHYLAGIEYVNTSNIEEALNEFNNVLQIHDENGRYNYLATIAIGYLTYIKENDKNMYFKSIKKVKSNGHYNDDIEKILDLSINDLRLDKYEKELVIRLFKIKFK